MELDTVVCMDALDFLRGLPDGSVDSYLLDLPYGTTACSWDAIIPFDLMWQEIRRTLKPRRVFLTTATEPFASQLRMSAFDWYKYDWVWVKTRPTDHLRAKLKPMTLCEYILVFSNGTVANHSDNQMNYFPQGLTHGKFYKKRNKVFSGGVWGRRPSHIASYAYDAKDYPSNVLYFPSVHNVDSFHPTEKPLALYEYLVRTYTQKNDIVVDFACGSGTTAVAARNLGRHFIGCDISPEYVAIANKRLALPYTPPLL